MSPAGGAVSSRPTRLGRYELITRIGQGGMAEVQLALQRGPAGFEKLVVVKLVHNNLASQKDFVDMLLDEARVAALVKHPNVVDIYDLGQANGRYFIAMEYLEGEPLLAVLRAGRDGKRLDVLSTGRLIADTAEGLDAAHELRSMTGDRLELVHHDISLGNIVVLYNGQVKLVDFGVAKATQSAGPRNKVQGKFSYMAPEKLRGAPGDRRSDIFSLGCVMWEALTLKRLFRGGNDAETMKQVLESTIKPPSRVNIEVPAEYDAIVMRALERDPAKRHRTAKELAVEIEELLRKRGYGAKNDKIARYMQVTFKAHIDARQKLVQEVVAKGSASAEVLDAAFSDPALASGSPITPVGARNSDFSMKHRRPTPSSGVPVPTASWADSSPRTTIRAPAGMHPMFDDGPTTGVGGQPLPDPLEAVASPSAVAHAAEHGASPGTRATSTGGRAKAIGTKIADTIHAIVSDRTQRIYAAIMLGAVLGLVIVIALAGKSGERPAEKVVEADSGSDTVTQVGSANLGSAEVDVDEIVIDPPSADPGSGSAQTEKTEKVEKVEKTEKVQPPRVEKVERPRPQPQPQPPVRPQPPPQPAIDVVDTVNQGLKAFVTGDSKGALALLQKAKAAKPGYAPTYRVLGKVHKKLGDRASAKAAFQRYLKLAPTASDAEQIRKELEEL